MRQAMDITPHFYHIKLILKITTTIFTPAAQPVNLRNVEKRKVARLGIGGLRYNFLQTCYAAGVKIPILKPLETFSTYML